MVRHVVIGTAGHIDHGKTALVKALTGVDTDRWAEEQRRGITIDLGFAPLSLDAETQVSIVDVPGHEGFVRNMLAGATGIDAALLIIAADEGVMPQTEEHLAIVELLRVRRGVPVFTKRDLVDDEWMQLLGAEVAARLEHSPVRWEAPVATSARTGAGLPELREAIGRVARDVADRAEQDLFRLPVDRVFTLKGAGTVVTGSTWSGTVGEGDSVRLLPGDREARVRSIESHGSTLAKALPGRRTALALAGVEHQEIARGHVVVTGDGWRPTTRLDAALEVLPSAPRPLTTRTRVRVHLGTAEVLARVTPVDPIAPGTRGVARLAFENPIVARGGDRFVIRSYSPVATIGGGSVIDPFPPDAPRRLRQRRLALDTSAADRLAGWVRESRLSGLARSDLPVRLGISPDGVAEVIALAGKNVLEAGDRLVFRAAASREAERLAGVLEAHHASHPLDAGMSLQALRASVGNGMAVSDSIIDLVFDLAGRKEILEVESSVARRPGWRAAVAARADGDASRISAHLAKADWRVPTVSELEFEFGGLPVRALLAHLLREGGVVQVDQERFAAPAALARFQRALEEVIREVGPVTPALLRDRLGLTRKYLIPLLEWADRRGITRREGDTRVLGRLTPG
ncbi:MAG TPA: selenocysteine-specific translation elongation factor [Gemmatimonadales bacterium]|nr:selenocysteine-specific translation elongation factor [Gemmatimonadales bacterium]